MTTPHQPINAVADFGADPTGQADSAAAIQAALQAAGALGAGGGAVYLPPGTYSIASASLVPVTGVRPSFAPPDVEPSAFVAPRRLSN